MDAKHGAMKKLSQKLEYHLIREHKAFKNNPGDAILVCDSRGCLSASVYRCKNCDREQMLTR